MKPRYRRRPNKPPIWLGYRNPDRRNIDTYPDRRVEKISISVESIGASPGWHHDAVEGSAFIAVMRDAPSSVIAFLPDAAT
jgi:hypothetical protein